MTAFELKEALDSSTLIVDSREKPTRALRERIQSIGWPCEQYKLTCGDYSIKCNQLTLEDKVAIERKMDLDELAMCFGRERKRFEAEFERAKSNNIRLYLLCEGVSWQRIYNETAYHEYCRSRLPSQSLRASLIAWQARYDMRIILCDKHEAPYLIKDILFRELKERLEHEPE